MEEYDGRKKSKTKKSWINKVLKDVGDGLGTLVGYEMTQKINSDLVTTNFFRIKWYGYGSIRTSLIKLLRAFLKCFDEKQIKNSMKITYL